MATKPSDFFADNLKRVDSTIDPYKYNEAQGLYQLAKLIENDLETLKKENIEIKKQLRNIYTVAASR